LPAPAVVESVNVKSRRQFLASVGGALAVGSAGCVRDSSESPPSDPEVREVDADQYRNVPRAPMDALPDGSVQPFAGYGIGDERVGSDTDPPHCVWVWNVADQTRELTVETSTTAETVFEHTTTFDPQSCLAIVLFAPATYTVAVSGGNWRETTPIERKWFDCNASATDVAVLADGRIETGGVTQQVGCG
jgi:hypothetical protein